MRATIFASLCAAVLIAAAMAVHGPRHGRAEHPMREAHYAAGLAERPRDKIRLWSPATRGRVNPLRETCQNGASCDNGEQCCNGGSFCCPNTTSCCGDTCCSNRTDYKAEACCPDPKNGGVCCLAESTFCCPPNPDLDQPSHCCPRWNVCCNLGRYGCCDPTTGLPAEQLHPNSPGLIVPEMRSPRKARNANGSVAYAIFEEPDDWEGDSALFGVQLDLVSGAVTRSVKLQQGVFHTEQEMTRKFLFARRRGVFMLPQANFTDPAEDFPIKLYTFDPVSGAVTAVAVTGARDEVTGYHYSDEADVIVMATSWVVTNQRVGYTFYHVDPISGAAKLVSRVNNSDYSFPDGDTYAGWFHEVSPDLMYAYRLGFKGETASVDYGLGITCIGAGPKAAITNWVSLSDPSEHGRLRSLHVANLTIDADGKLIAGQRRLAGGNSPLDVAFVSLAPAENLTDYQDLAAYVWSPAAPTAMHKVSQFGNAHLQAYFGPIAEGLDTTRVRYAAAVVADSALGDSFDSWTLALADLATGQSTLVPLTPTLLASTSSISAFGIPE